MAETMFKRVAKAIADQMEAEDPGEGYTPAEFATHAMTVLRAMREPTERC